VVGLVMRLYRASPLHPHLGAGLARLLGRFTRHLPSPQLRSVDGIRFELDLSEVIDASLFFSGSFEPRAERTIARHLGPGATAIDVGANIGYHTLRMARSVGARGRVVAIEPAARAGARLRRNLELNPFTNVAVVVAALSDHDSEREELELQSSYPLSGRGGMERVRVRVSRLDTLVSELVLERVDLIKIDVDGHEGRVLRGALGTLERFRPTVFFELTPSAVEKNGDSVAELLGSLHALGYTIADEQGKSLPDPVGVARFLPRGAGRNLLARPRQVSGARVPAAPTAG